VSYWRQASQAVFEEGDNRDYYSLIAQVAEAVLVSLYKVKEPWDMAVKAYQR